MMQRWRVALLGALPRAIRGRVRALRRPGHPRRRPAAHRGRHGLQLPAGQGRRDDDRRKARRRRCARCSPPASSRTCASRSRATCWWCSSRSARRSRRSTSSGMKEFAPTRCARCCATSASPKVASSTGRCSTRPSRRSSASTCLAGCTASRCRPRSRRSSATASASTSPSTRARWRRSGHQHRRRAGVQREASCSSSCCPHARLAHLVHQERPVLAREAVRRPRDAALVLPQPRLPRLHPRVDAGVDHARPARHLHHDQRDRGREVHGLEREARRRAARCPSPS